jgi:hypothetical protein
MPDRFLSYLQHENRRLGEELEQAQARHAEQGEIKRLLLLRDAVADQLSRWSADLGVHKLAA